MSAWSAEDRSGLHVNIFGVLGPLMPPLGQVVECLVVTHVRPGSGQLGKACTDLERATHRKVDDTEHIATAKEMKADGHTGKDIAKCSG